jgi:esterase/lipase
LKEDEFNRNAAMVPESDPNVALINDKIAELKERVEKASTERTQQQVEYRRLYDERVARFTGFFDLVATHVDHIYALLTAKEGQSGRA